MYGAREQFKELDGTNMDKDFLTCGIIEHHQVWCKIWGDTF